MRIIYSTRRDESTSQQYRIICDAIMRKAFFTRITVHSKLIDFFFTLFSYVGRCFGSVSEKKKSRISRNGVLLAAKAGANVCVVISRTKHRYLDAIQRYKKKKLHFSYSLYII